MGRRAARVCRVGVWVRMCGDGFGRWIADTACAGYGWSEVFYSPRKQIEMINGELGERHGLTIVDLIRRQLTGQKN